MSNKGPSLPQTNHEDASQGQGTERDTVTQQVINKVIAKLENKVGGGPGGATLAAVELDSEM